MRTRLQAVQPSPALLEVETVLIFWEKGTQSSDQQSAFRGVIAFIYLYLTLLIFNVETIILPERIFL
jgi:hypothetical protein